VSGYLPIPGSPDVVAGLAAALRDEAQRVASAHERLLSLRHGTRWDSPAGRAFAAEAARLPLVLDAVAHRYAGAAAALRTFAAAFREAQRACNLAISLRERGAWRRDRYAEALARAETSGSPAELAQAPELHRLMVEGAAEVLEAERRWASARERFEEADLRCRRTLATLAQDAVTDTFDYDTVKGAARLADTVTATAGHAAMVPAWRPVATAVGATSAASGVALDTLVKVAYGEGEWGPLVEETGLGVVGFGASSLRTAALMRGLPSGAHQGPVGFAGPSRRLGAGVKAQAGANDPWQLRPVTVRPRPPSPATGPTGSSSTRLPERVRAAVRRPVDRRVTALRGEWGTATRNGADARAMLLTAWGLQAGSRAYTGAKQVNAAYERAVLARERWHREREAEQAR
jgi:hypothetical protein